MTEQEIQYLTIMRAGFYREIYVEFVNYLNDLTKHSEDRIEYEDVIDDLELSASNEDYELSYGFVRVPEEMSRTNTCITTQDGDCILTIFEVKIQDFTYSINITKSLINYMNGRNEQDVSESIATTAAVVAEALEFLMKDFKNDYEEYQNK